MTAVIMGDYIFFLKGNYVLLARLSHVQKGVYKKMFAWTWLPQKRFSSIDLLISDTDFYITHPTAGWNALDAIKIPLRTEIRAIMDKLSEHITDRTGVRAIEYIMD